MLALAEGEGVVALLLGGDQGGQRRLGQERVVDPLGVLAQQRQGDPALVGLADALEGLEQPLGAEQLQEAGPLLLVGQQVAAPEDREQRVPAQEGGEHEEDEAALVALPAPRGAVLGAQLEGAVAAGEDRVVRRVRREAPGDPQLGQRTQQGDVVGHPGGQRGAQQPLEVVKDDEADASDRSAA